MVYILKKEIILSVWGYYYYYYTFLVMKPRMPQMHT